MPRRSLAILPSLLAATVAGACAATESVSEPGGAGEARTVTSALTEDGVYTVCGVKMRVETFGKIKPIGLPSRAIIAYPSTTVRLTNTGNARSITLPSSGTVLLVVQNDILVAVLRGRNVLVDTLNGTARQFVGSFTERVISENNAVFEGSGQITDLCPQLIG